MKKYKVDFDKVKKLRDVITVLEGMDLTVNEVEGQPLRPAVQKLKDSGYLKEVK